MWDTLSLGRRDAGAHLRPAHEEGHRHQRPRRRADRRHARVLQGKGLRRIRPTTASLAAVTPGTPGGIMTMVAEYGKLSLKDVLGAGHRDGRRLRDRGAVGEHDRAQQGQAEELAVLEEGLPHSRRRRQASRPVRRRDLPPARPRRHAAQARRGRAAGARRRGSRARRRSTPRTTASTKATSPRRSSAARASRAASSPRRISRTGRCTSRSR